MLYTYIYASMNKYIIPILTFLYTTAGLAEENRKLTITGNKNLPPYEFVNEKGEADGFNVELIRNILDELNQPYEIQLEDFSKAFSHFENREADILISFVKFKTSKNDERLSRDYNSIEYNIVCRKNSSIQRPEDLANKQIFVQKSSMPYLKLTSMQYNLMPLDNIEEGLKMLSNGIGDALICPGKFAQHTIYKYGLTDLDIIDTNWLPRSIHFVVNDPLLLEQINGTLRKLEENGIYDRIYTKWFGEKNRLHIPTWMYLLLGALLLTALLLYIAVHFYKQKIKRGKSLLQKENKKLNNVVLENQYLLKRYQSIFSTGLVGFSYYDKNGIMIDINNVMLEFYGQKDKDTFLQKAISIYKDPVLQEYGVVDKDKQIHEYHGIIKLNLKKNAQQFHYTGTDEDATIYCKMDIIPIKNEQEELEGIIITAINQTSEIEHKQQLAEQGLKLDLAMEAGKMAAWTFNPQTQMFQTLRGNAIAGKGLLLEDNIKTLHPDDRANQERILNALIEGTEDNGHTTFRYLHKDGTYHYYESHMITKKEKGKVIAILGMQKDITEEVHKNEKLKDSLKRLQFAIQTANMVMWEYDRHTRLLTTYNDPITDYEDGASILIEKHNASYRQDKESEERIKNITELMDKGTDRPYTILVKMMAPNDSEWQYYTVNGVPIEKDPEGKVNKYIGVRLNISEQIAYQKTLEKEKEKAQRADKLKSMFLANMSHEIRTPLNAIVGFSELLQNTNVPEERNEYIQIIKHNNEILLQLINDILDLSKIESGFIDLMPEVFDMADVIRESFMAFKQRNVNPDIQFLIRSPYKCCKVKLDKKRITQIFTNFMTNAIKHTTKGHILIGYEYTDKGIRIYVEDTGCGIPEKKQSKLFQRFAKLDYFTQGTGLGLAICKAITDAKNGKIGMTSKEGEGSTFWAWFPCEAEIEEPEEEIVKENTTLRGSKDYDASPENHTAQTQNMPDDSAFRKHILVAEDNDSNYLLVRATLKAFDLTRAKTGKEAVELASAYHYDFILMDMKMPEMNGIEATREIRKFDQSTPIFAVTANAFDSDKEAALEAGCNAFITKPIHSNKLKDLLN